jgi:hypothetical protein
MISKATKFRVSLRILNGRHAGRHHRIGWQVKRDRQNESDGETVGDNRNFGIAHRSTSPKKIDHSALRGLSQARFDDLTLPAWARTSVCCAAGSD